MKKKKETKERKITTAKPMYKVLLCFVTTVLTMLILCTGIFAANDVVSTNRQLCKDALDSLGEEIDGYTASDSSTGKTVSQKTIVAINVYRKELLSLEESALSSTVSLEDKIELSYQKAIAAGKTAWVYFSRCYEYPVLSSDPEFTSEYEKTSSLIASATNADVLERSVNGYISSLNKSAFSELIRNEGSSGDSLAVNAIIEGAIDEIGKLTSADPSGAEHKKIYETAVADVSLRRTKDELTSQLEAVYKRVYPSLDFSSDKNVALFIYKLDGTNQLEEMNIVLNNTIKSLLDPLKKEKYTSQYIDKLCQAVAERCDAATVAQSVPTVSEEFLNFSFEYKKEECKDELLSHIAASNHANDQQLVSLESEYNGAGGRFDSSLSESEADFELERAKLRVDWYGEYLAAETAIKDILTPHDPAKLLSELEAEYQKYDTSISLIPFSQSNAQSLVIAEFGKGMAALETIKINAKAEKYLFDHDTIIKKAESEISSSDLEALKLSLTDAIALDPEVYDVIKDTAHALISKYKISLKAELGERDFKESTHLWNDCLDELYKEIDSFSSSLSLPDLYASLTRTAERANAIEHLIFSYIDIISSDEYSSYTDNDKIALISACQDAIEIILDVNITPISWSERLAEARENGSLVLRKAQLSAKLTAMANAAKSEDAARIAKEAREKISATLTGAEAEAIFDSAEFKLLRILYYEEILAKADSISESINALEYLGELAKSDFCDKISKDIDSVSAKISIAANRAALDEAYKNALDFLSEIEDGANAENLRLAKKQAQMRLETANKEKEAAISALIYVSSAQKQALSDKLSELNIALKSAVEACETVTELDGLWKNIEKALAELTNEISSTELEACRNMIRSKYAEITNLQSRYSAENYNLLTSIIEPSIEFINSCESIDDCISEMNDVIKAVENIPDLLDTAKIEAIAKLDTLFSTLESEENCYSVKNFTKISGLYASYRKEIEGINNFNKLNDVGATVSKAISDICSIPKDRIYTHESVISSGNTAKYPAGYSISEKGYSAFLYAPEKLPHNGTLKLSSISTSGSERLLRKALRADKVYFASSGAAISEELAKELKKCDVLLGFSTETTIDFDGSQYMLTILLPDSIAKESIKGLISIGENKSVEFYNYTLDGSLLTVSLSAPTSLYLVVEGNGISLLAIITLILLILILALVIGFLIHQYTQKAPAEPTAAITSSGTTALETLHGTRDVTTTQKSSPPQPVKQADKAPDEADEPQSSESDTDNESTADEDETIIIDNDAVFADISRKEKKRSAETREKEKLRRTEINLDVIAANFKAGETVTLETMIERGLLPHTTTFVKVLARGKINKPLTIIAQDFSVAAMKMIFLAGGTAIITEEKQTDQ